MASFKKKSNLTSWDERLLSKLGSQLRDYGPAMGFSDRISAICDLLKMALRENAEKIPVDPGKMPLF